MSRKLTDAQRRILHLLRKWEGEGFMPSSNFKEPSCPKPGPVLKQLEGRGFVETNGVNIPGEGKVYKITQAGKDALAT